MYKYHLVFVAVFALMMLSGANAFADMIIDPAALTSVDWTPTGIAQNGFQWGGYPATNAIDGTGLNVPGIYPTGTPVPVPGDWAQTTGANGWFGYTGYQGGLPETITFDLGDSYNLSGVHIWNFSQNLDRGLNNVTVLAAKAVENQVDHTFSPGPFAPVTGPNLDGSYTFAESTGASDTGNTYSLGASDIRYVEFTINSDWGSDSYTGLNQIRFVGTAYTTPEPSALMLLATGLIGLLAYAWRKRK